MSLPDVLGRDWNGSRVADEPIVVSHVLAGTEAEGMRLLMRTPLPTGDFYLDRKLDVAVRFPGYARSGISPQLLRTRRAGYEYEIAYHREGDEPLQIAREWHRTMLLIALPARRRGVMAHAAGFILPNGAGVLCPGVSGTGKSTLASTILQERADVVGLSDDRIAVTTDDRALRLWGTPWHSAAGTSSPDDAPCRALVFVRHGADAALSPLAPAAALRRLLRSVAIPFWNAAASAYALEVIDRLITELPSFEFTYAPAPPAGRVFVDRLTAVLETSA